MKKKEQKNASPSQEKEEMTEQRKFTWFKKRKMVQKPQKTLSKRIQDWIKADPKPGKENSISSIKNISELWATPNIKKKTLPNGAVSILWKNKNFSDTNLSKDIEMVKGMNVDEMKKKLKLTSSKAKLLDKMLADYKHLVSLTGLYDKPNSNSTTLLTKEKILKILENYKNKKEKNDLLSLKKFEYYSPYAYIDDVREIYNFVAHYHNNLIKSRVKHSVLKLKSTIKRSKIDNALLFVIVNNLEAAQRKKKVSSLARISSMFFRLKANGDSEQ